MKERLDILLVKKKLAESREKAKDMIVSGNVYVEGKKEEKAGKTFEESAFMEVRGDILPYVSRAGLKLEKAIKVFDIDLEGKICMDVGASTGGFTDCMLQNKAKKVYCVDVGHGQLSWKLQKDERVICMEKTNIRYLTKKDITEEIEFVSIDVSFISLTKVLLPVKELMMEKAKAVCLIKPQFEVGKEKIGKKGVVKERKVQEEVIEMVSGYAKEIGFSILGLDYSPIKGSEGNIEYLLYLQKKEEEENMDFSIKKMVALAHESL